jgi:hypothetical protein
MRSKIDGNLAIKPLQPHGIRRNLTDLAGQA